MWPEFPRLFQQITVTIESGFKRCLFLEVSLPNWLKLGSGKYYFGLVSIISGNEAEVLSVDLS